MASFTTQLTKKQQVAQGTMAFYFEKPKNFTYIPGQHISLGLINPPTTDQEGNMRTLSLITIPSDSEIGITTRVRTSAFKQNLKNLEVGTKVEVLDPRGSMVLPKGGSRPLVFLAGGIGITPFISMVRQAVYEKYPQKITFFYANRTQAEAPFLQELEELSKNNPNFVFIPVMTRETAPIWSGETGHISIDMLKKHLPTMSDTVFYLAGPAGFVGSATDLLDEAGVDPLFIKSEDFGEYK